MPADDARSLALALDAFVAEHRRCGDMEGGVDSERAWMACSCGAAITHPISDPLSEAN